MVKAVIFIIGLLLTLNFVTIANAISDYRLESEHPINFDHSNKWTYSRDWQVNIPSGANHIRFHIVKWSLGSDDKVIIYDNNGKQISKNSNGANGEDYWSPWLTSEGYIKVQITSGSGEAYGFNIDQIDTDVDPDSSYVADTTPEKIEDNTPQDQSTVVDTSSSSTQTSDNSDASNTYINPQATQETVQEPEPMTVIKHPEQPHKLTAAGKRLVQTGKMKMPVDIQPTKPETPTGIITLYAQNTNVDVKQGIPVTFTVSNKITKPVMHCQMTIIPQSGITVDSIENAEGQSGQYHSVADIEPGKSNTISATLTPNSAGDYTVKGNAVLYYGKDLTTQEEDNVDVTIHATVPITAQTDKPTSQNNPVPTADDKLTSIAFNVLCLIGLFIGSFIFYLAKKRALPWQ